MGWFAKKRQLVTTPPVTAELLHRICAVEDYPHAAPEVYRLPPEFHESFQAKVFRYREAIVLMHLAQRAREEPLFEQPLREYERLVFPTSSEAAGAETKLQLINEAMSDISKFVDSDDSEKLTWCHQWFNSIGYDGADPYALTLFLIFWTDLHTSVHNGVKAMVK